MKTKKITLVRKKLLAEGQGKHGKWQLIGLEDQDGLTFTTFRESKYEEGREYELVYEEVSREKNGQKFTDLRIVEKSEKQLAKEAFFERFKKLEERVAALEKFITDQK